MSDAVPFYQLPLLYEIPDRQNAATRRTVTYRSVGGANLHMDIYPT